MRLQQWNGRRSQTTTRRSQNPISRIGRRTTSERAVSASAQGVHFEERIKLLRERFATTYALRPYDGRTRFGGRFSLQFRIKLHPPSLVYSSTLDRFSPRIDSIKHFLVRLLPLWSTTNFRIFLPLYLDSRSTRQGNHSFRSFVRWILVFSTRQSFLLDPCFRRRFSDRTRLLPLPFDSSRAGNFPDRTFATHPL